MKKSKEIQTASWKKSFTCFAAVALCSVVLAGGAVPALTSIVLADEITQETERAVDEIRKNNGRPARTMEQLELTVDAVNTIYTADEFAKRKKTFKIDASASGETGISYEVIDGSKYISVDKQGNVTIKKGTPSGDYAISVTAEGMNGGKLTKIVEIEVTSNMEEANISWDLENNKTVTYKAAYCDAPSIMKDGKLTIKNYTVTDAKKSGYKQLTFRAVFNRPTSFSKKELDIIGNDLDKHLRDFSEIDDNFYVSFVDYETGECLECKNAYNVTSKYGKWIYSGTEKTFKFPQGGRSKRKPTASVQVTVTYPKSYKNLCIVAGGYSTPCGYYDIWGSRSAGDYFKGRGNEVFSQVISLYSEKYKTVAHAMRVE